MRKIKQRYRCCNRTGLKMQARIYTTLMFTTIRILIMECSIRIIYWHVNIDSINWNSIAY